MANTMADAREALKDLRCAVEDKLITAAEYDNARAAYLKAKRDIITLQGEAAREAAFLAKEEQKKKTKMAFEYEGTIRKMGLESKKRKLLIDEHSHAFKAALEHKPALMGEWRKFVGLLGLPRFATAVSDDPDSRTTATKKRKKPSDESVPRALRQRRRKPQLRNWRSWRLQIKVRKGGDIYLCGACTWEEATFRPR